ncbi:MAG: NFACT family protein [Proteobacteria bacterium]|nr:NFACT family protein [Pseudomonadota bacterium]
MSGFKASKCFEGAGPVLIWAATTRLDDGRWWKGYLIADAQQQSFGVRLEAAKGDDLKVYGGVVTMIRKHARTAAIGAVLADPVHGHIWLPLFTGGGYSETPRYWLQLAQGLPPELRFVDATGTALIRKSSQGTYTKRWTLPDSLPVYPPDGSLIDITMTLLSAATMSADSTGEASASAELSPTDASDVRLVATPGASPLPDYQRSARDRLSRRLKTLHKSAQRLEQEQARAAASTQLSLQATQLAAFLHLVRPDMIELRLSPAETGLAEELVIPLDGDKSPGQNLTDLHVQIKKSRRAATTLKAQLAALADDVTALTQDLSKLRTATLPLQAVEAMLQRYHLSKASQAQAPEEAKTPFRTIYWQPAATQEAAGRIRILVGKSAADSDELCRQAKGHDLWIHVVGTTGSHVIIPFRQLKGGIDQQLIRAAAILALHYSKLRGDERGEVYVSRRQFIRKRKGMPPGLWQVDQAETMFFRYDAAELARLLSQTEGP